jgi:hypothetical protein
MICDFSQSLICPRCGYRAQHANTFRNCSPPPRRPPFMIGDAVERLLAAVGLTPARIEWWLGKPCGCSGRKAWLNRAGVAVQEWVSRAVEAAARFYGFG